VLDRALTLATSRQNTSAFALAYLTQGRALLHWPRANSTTP